MATMPALRITLSLADLAVFIMGTAIAFARTPWSEYEAEWTEGVHLSWTASGVAIQLAAAINVGLAALLILRMIRDHRGPRRAEWLPLIVATFVVIGDITPCALDFDSDDPSGYNLASEPIRRLRGFAAMVGIGFVAGLLVAFRNRIPGCFRAVAIVAAVDAFWWGPASLFEYELEEAVVDRIEYMSGTEQFWGRFVATSIARLPSSLVYMIPAAMFVVDLFRGRSLGRIAGVAFVFLLSWAVLSELGPLFIVARSQILSDWVNWSAVLLMDVIAFLFGVGCVMVAEFGWRRCLKEVE